MVAGSIPAEGAKFTGVIMQAERLKARAIEFLGAYEAKDLHAISKLITDDVVVRDWNLELLGKPEALRLFAKNFEAADSLAIRISQLMVSDASVAAEIEIEVNHSEHLKVVDVIHSNQKFEITAVVSYKGL